MTFSIGQHIESKENGIHGIVYKISENIYGTVYCINIKGRHGRACINENDCKLYMLLKKR